MSKYRKKPIVIEAHLWNGDIEALIGWAESFPHKAAIRFDLGALVVIETLEGNMTAQKGDWIIRGVKGELYPCKPDIFAATYEPVEESG
jgi:hypothetical protein